MEKKNSSEEKMIGLIKEYFNIIEESIVIPFFSYHLLPQNIR